LDFFRTKIVSITLENETTPTKDKELVDRKKSKVRLIFSKKLEQYLGYGKLIYSSE
jgi:hypothetical protein